MMIPSQSLPMSVMYTFLPSLESVLQKQRRVRNFPLRIRLTVLLRTVFCTSDFALVMFIVYYVSITTVGGFLTDWTNDTLFGEWIIPGARTLLENIHCAGWLTGLVVDGIISGVGAVLGFVPQMLVLFISWHSLSPVDICHVSHLSWTVFSVNSDYPENHSSQC